MSKHEQLRLLQASLQSSDKDREVERTVKRVFDVADGLKVDSIGFSETQRGQHTFERVQAEAHERGWWLQAGATGDVRFAVNPINDVIGHDYEHVLDANGGMPKGNYGPKGVSSVRYLTEQGNDVSVSSTHWLTAYQLDRRPGHEGQRESRFGEQTDAMIVAVKAAGEGRRLSFWQGDTNLDEREDTFDLDALHVPFRRAGLVSIYDELYPGRLHQLPKTHGRRTIDVIGKYNPDRRVKAVRVRALPRKEGTSDHLMVLGVYDVDPLPPLTFDPA